MQILLHPQSHGNESEPDHDDKRYFLSPTYTRVEAVPHDYIHEHDNHHGNKQDHGKNQRPIEHPIQILLEHFHVRHLLGSLLSMEEGYSLRNPLSMIHDGFSISQAI
jgi:hypothetical protein